MKFLLQSVMISTTLALTLFGQNAASQNTTGHNVDRIVAAVHGQVITESDWNEEERVTALLEGRPVVSHGHTGAALQRLIERTLVLEQMTGLDFKRSTAQDIDTELASVRKQLPGSEDNTTWLTLLTKYRVDEEYVRRRLGEQRDMLRFLDIRFRSGVRITQREIQSYYTDVLIPQLHAKNVIAPPVTEVREKIIAILTEQRMNSMLDDWIKELKANGAIRWLVPEVQTTGSEAEHP